MRAIACPIAEERLRDLYAVQKLTDETIVELLRSEGHNLGNTFQTRIKRVRSWRRRFGIETVPRWDRNQVPPIEGRLKSILVGSMLGDGRLAFRGQATAYGEFHCTEQLNYLKWKMAEWGPAWLLRPEPIPIGSSGFRLATVVHSSLNEWQALFYADRERGWKRLVPALIEHVDELALAIWYLDDGHAGWWPSITFGADLESRRVAFQILAKFDLHPSWHDHVQRETTGSLTMRGEAEALRFIEIIRPHVPACMAYKLGPFGFQGKHYQVRAALTEEKLRPLAEANTPIKVIARELGVGATTVCRYLEKFGIPHQKLRGNPRHRDG